LSDIAIVAPEYDAGLKAGADSAHVILASGGQAVALHVAGRNRERIAWLARFVQDNDPGLAARDSYR
jgi:hypothetical protein